MNKYKDVLEHLKHLSAVGLRYLETQQFIDIGYEYDKVVEHTEALQELVDKETPMKVTEKLDAPVSYSQYRKCPKCKSLVSRLWLYCSECGQKLDWSDIND